MATQHFFFDQGLQFGKIDPINGVIYGVSVITCGIKARGHDLEVDRTTLTQLKECAEKMGTVPVKWNHRSGADAVAGYLSNFRVDGAKLLGDWHLLKSHDGYGHALELAERMPRNIGLSAAFLGEDETAWEGADKKMLARCSELISVDLVAQPAANPNGLFEAKLPGAVDSEEKGQPMADNKQNPNGAEPSNADVLAAINGLADRINSVEAGFQSLQENQEALAQGMQEGGDEELTRDDLLAILSLDEAQVQEALESGELTHEDVQDIISLHEAVASGEIDLGEGESEGYDDAEAGAEAEQAGQYAGAGAGVDFSPSSADAGVATALNALHGKVTELSSRFERADRAAEEGEVNEYFSRIEHNFAELTEGNSQLKELSEKLHSENEVLRHALKTGVRPLAFSADGGKALRTNGGELHEFQSLVEKHLSTGKSEAEAIRMAHKDNPEAHADYLRTL